MEYSHTQQTSEENRRKEQKQCKQLKEIADNRPLATGQAMLINTIRKYNHNFAPVRTTDNQQPIIQRKWMSNNEKWESTERPTTDNIIAIFNTFLGDKKENIISEPKDDAKKKRLIYIKKILLSTYQDETEYTIDELNDILKNIFKQIDAWYTKYTEKGVARRKDKQSTAMVKRQKLYTQTGIVPRLMFTHTAPRTKDDTLDKLSQGKEVFIDNKKEYTEYFRTGENVQSSFFKIQNGKKNWIKLFIFIPELFKFYKELYPKIKFNQYRLKNTFLYKTINTSRYEHSGLGSEVNSYSKNLLLESLNEHIKIHGGPEDKAKAIAEKEEKSHQIPGRREGKASPSGLSAKKEPKTDDKATKTDDKEPTDFNNYSGTLDTKKTTPLIKRLADSGRNGDGNYTDHLLTQCQYIAKEISSRATALESYKIVIATASSTTGQDRNFITYPCPVIEPVVPKGISINTEFIKEYIREFLEIFNIKSSIKMAARNSFGFLYPTISDLDRSVRLWPGQVDPEDYVNNVIDTLKSMDHVAFTNGKPNFSAPSVEDTKTIDMGMSGTKPMEIVNPELMKVDVPDIQSKEMEGSNTESMKIEKKPILYYTLLSAMKYIRSIYNKGFTNCKKTEILKILNNRMLSNLSKAHILLEQFEDKNYKSYPAIFMETTQVIENLNEFGLQLIELQDWEVDDTSILESIENYYGNAISAGDFTLKHAQLAHSGMQAGMIAHHIARKTKFTSGPGYFEFPNSEKLQEAVEKEEEAAKKEDSVLQQPQNIEDKEATTLHYDPAYNFTHTEEVTGKNAHGKEDEKTKQEKKEYPEDSYNYVIMDITNVTPGEITKILQRHKNSQAIFLYGSLSKHFQLGMDRFTFGLVMELYKKPSGSEAQPPMEPYLKGYDMGIPDTLKRYFILMQGAHNLTENAEPDSVPALPRDKEKLPAKPDEGMNINDKII